MNDYMEMPENHDIEVSGTELTPPCNMTEHEDGQKSEPGLVSSSPNQADLGIR